MQSYPKGNYIYYGKSVEETPGLFTGYYRIEYVGKNPEEAKFVSEEFKRFNGPHLNMQISLKYMQLAMQNIW